MHQLILLFDRQRYPRLLHGIVYAVGAIVLLAFGEASAHELEDGFVERSAAVIVRPGEVTISYSIGANEATRRQLAESWRCEKNGDAEATSESHAAVEPGQEEGDVSFLDAVGDAVMRRIAVEADGNPVDLEVVEVMPTPRHHVEATVVMRLKLPSPLAGANSILLEFHDRNFEKCRSEPSVPEAGTVPRKKEMPSVPLTMGGAFRYAIKGANGAMLNRSTVAPILVRAKRRLVAEIPADQLSAEQQFSAEVILP